MRTRQNLTSQREKSLNQTLAAVVSISLGEERREGEKPEVQSKLGRRKEEGLKDLHQSEASLLEKKGEERKGGGILGRKVSGKGVFGER